MTESQPPPPTALVPPTPVPQAGMVQPVLAYGELERAAMYVAMVRTLRGIGIGNIIWGSILLIIGIIILAVGAGSTSFGDVPLMVIFALFLLCGVVFIGEGIWLIVAPSASGLLVAAISMFVSAFLFLRGILVMLVLGFYGAALLRRYKKIGPLLTERPAKDMEEQAGSLLTKLIKANYRKDLDVIEFRSTDAFCNRYWRGLLLDRLVVLITLEERAVGKALAEVYFLPPSGLQIESPGRVAIGKLLKGVFHVNELKVTGTIPPECYERFDAWQRQYALPPAPPPVATPVPPGM